MADNQPGLPALSDEQRARLLDRLQARAERAARADRISPQGGGGPAPLSFAQQRLWVIDQLTPGSAVYNMPVLLRLRGPLDAGALEWALGEIVRRHEALRTTFAAADGEPKQVIAPPGPFALPAADLSGLPADGREAAAQRAIDDDARRPFDLARGPLFRPLLVRTGDQDHGLLLNMHHIVSDGWSIGVLLREVAALYGARVRGERAALPDLAIQYADFAVWQRRWLQGDVRATQLAYWAERLAGAPEGLELPADRPRPAMFSGRGATILEPLPSALGEALGALSRREGSTLFMTLLAAFQVLLARYTSQTDLVVGSPVAGRTRAELEGLIGFFVNMLVLRTDLSGDPPFREVLRRAREATLGAQAHQDLPFEQLVEALRARRDLSGTPLFQVAFSVSRNEIPALPGLTAGFAPVQNGTAKFDLTLLIDERPDGLWAVAEYSTDLFDAATIERLLGHYRTLLEGITADPGARVSMLPLLTARERDALREWNATERPYPDACAHTLIEAQARARPEAEAFVQGDVRLTYGELNRRANRLAHHLRRLGVGPDVLVGICVDRSADMVVGALGVLKAGGAYVPLDPSYPADRLAFMLEDSRAPVLLTQEALLDRLPATTAHVACLDRDWSAIARERDTAPDPLAGPDNLAYVIYTSGTTGKPKGVMLPHRGLTQMMSTQADVYGVRPGGRILQFAAFSFDASVWELFMALGHGATLIMASTDERRDPALLAALLARERVTVGVMMPSVIERLPLDAGPALEALTAGGDICPPALAVRWAPRVRFGNAYGPTEITFGCSVWHAPAEVDPGRPVPIGGPLPNYQMHVLDARGQPVPVGLPGELYVGGVGVGRGYLDRPALTAERFVPDPFGGEPGARLYRTGDLARWLPDGTIEFLGRIDHQVKIRGYRIELGEIEAVLGDHPAVAQAIVAARQDAPGERRLVAYVVARRDPPSVGELRAHLQARLPDYMVPAVFVTLPALPVAPNGKVDRAALPAPEGVRPDLDHAYVAPRTPHEQVLADIWKQVLRLERVGVHDDFFELGGDSMMSLQMVSRVNAAGLPVTAVQLFQHRTIAALAEAASGALDEQTLLASVAADELAAMLAELEGPADGGA